MKTINTKNAPQAIGSYSQAKIVGNFIFTSGQIPLKIDGTMVTDDFKKECIQVLDNLNEILKCWGIFETFAFFLIWDFADFEKFDENDDNDISL